MWADGIDGGVGEDDRCLGAFQDVYHCLVRYVGQIHHHTQSVHLLDALLAIGGQTLVLQSGGDAGRSGGKGVVTVVGHGDVSHAELVVQSDDRQREVHLVQAFDTEGDCNLRALRLGERFHGLLGVVDELEVVRVLVHQSLDDIDLLQGVSDYRVRLVEVLVQEILVLALDPAGEELQPDPALLHLHQVRVRRQQRVEVEAWRVQLVMELCSQQVREIVVGVYNRHSLGQLLKSFVDRHGSVCERMKKR